MNKTIRIVLYVLSILTVAGVIAAAVLTGGQAKPASAPGATAEEEQADMSDAQATLDGAATADGSGISTDGTEMAGEDGSISENAATAGENGSISDDAATAGETANQSDDTTTAAGTGSASDETANKDNQKDSGDTTIILTGDVLFANAFKAAYDAGGIERVVSPELLEQLKAADILMVNNEFPFSDRGEPMADKQFTFRCSPSYVKAFNEMGVDIVSLANNHTLDYGRAALSDTFLALDEAGILYGGAGDSVERAKEVQVMEVNGKKYGFIAVSRVVPSADWKIENATPGMFTCYDSMALIEVIKEAKQTCDFVTVFPHWGTEYSEQPNAVQRELAKKCMDAGADLVVGAHTHCLEGIEYIDGKPVFYSLGNFIFGQNIDRSAAVKVTVTEDGTVSYALIPVYASDGQTKQMDANVAPGLFSYMESISDNASVDEAGNISEK